MARRFRPQTGCWPRLEEGDQEATAELWDPDKTAPSDSVDGQPERDPAAIGTITQEPPQRIALPHPMALPMRLKGRLADDF
ncbi:hypothetical protein KL86PLE_100761 [uncultured Pleomorphomonas sp.]|uniref:Uncharacterized protein n=1 Tax=uncultured Pleomorphomonas sp. TaxID=442121 RepID=A0A212L6F3_9HYPH|nr:hypothetical protein KL86PLE_100761 [uncultured Pleomorphomonas sp.]